MKLFDKITFCLFMVILSFSISFCSEGFEDTESSIVEFALQNKEFGLYELNIRKADSEPFSVDKRIESLGTNFNRVVDGEREFFVDTEISSGLTYEYQVLSESGKVIKTFKVSIPNEYNTKHLKGFIDSNLLKANKPNKNGIRTIQLNRLKIDEDYPLITKGHNLHIIVNELIDSENASILTFSPEEKSQPSQSGLSGGNLTLEILAGIGSIDIYMKGIDGGDGITPMPLGEEGRGTKGRQGLSGIEYHIQNVVGATKIYCEQDPGRGLPGGTGLKGLSGGNGGNGGSTGSLKVILHKNASIDVGVDYEVGAPGVGAPGGEGGPGGYGGDPGFIAIKYDAVEMDGLKNPRSKKRQKLPPMLRPCNKAVSGKQGLQGAQGDHGVDGSIGSIGTFCIELKSENTTNCF